MAFVQRLRAAFQLQNINQKSKHFLIKKVEKTNFAKQIIVTLSSTHGAPADRKKPWPYKTKGFRYWHIPFDRVDSRLDDNSKIIVIDGNIATGKTELGKKIAKEFDMLYVSDASDVDLYTRGDLKVDIREFDAQLPYGARTCDFETFYSQSGPALVLKNFARTQYELFKCKAYHYAQNIFAHLLNTGQGVVMNRGMWSDIVFAQTLRKLGYMSPDAMKGYQFQYDALTIQELWHPHLIIYLDAPIDMVRKNIKKRNVPWEVNSPVLTDDFLQAMRDNYISNYLPAMSVWSEIMTIDLGETPNIDFEILVEDLETLDLDNAPRDNEKRFSDWWNIHNRDYNFWRAKCSKINEHLLREQFTFMPPYNAPELVLSSDDAISFEKIVMEDPRLKYDPKHQPDDLMRMIRV